MNNEFVEELALATTAMVAAANRMKQAADLFDRSNASLIQFLDTWMTEFKERLNESAQDAIVRPAPAAEGV